MFMLTFRIEFSYSRQLVHGEWKIFTFMFSVEENCKF